jgi:hypothetical protein
MLEFLWQNGQHGDVLLIDLEAVFKTVCGTQSTVEFVYRAVLTACLENNFQIYTTLLGLALA